MSLYARCVCTACFYVHCTCLALSHIPPLIQSQMCKRSDGYIKPYGQTFSSHHFSSQTHTLTHNTIQNGVCVASVSVKFHRFVTTSLCILIQICTDFYCIHIYVYNTISTTEQSALCVKEGRARERVTTALFKLGLCEPMAYIDIHAFVCGERV